jgi:glycosyltransferase involved in cell wall biosynthesis
MKILCFIDSLGSGGAQRQLIAIAVGLKKRGHQIRFLVYHNEDHFFPLLQAENIPCQIIPPCSYLQRIVAVRRIMRQGWQDVVLAFLEASCLYAELASIPSRKWGLVVGERLADPRMKTGIRWWLRQFHRLADAVVCNSYTNQLIIEALFPFLKSKLCTIYNTVNLELFHSNTSKVGDSCIKTFRIVIAASYQEKKNMMNVAKALLCLKEMHILPSIVIDWFGTVQPESDPFINAKKFIDKNGLSDSFRLHNATRNIADELSSADAVGLFSFYEGLPNVICEGMACNKPIIMSNVCDADNLVRNGVNGFLCDPRSPEDIAHKIQLMLALSELERKKMGFESRKLAEILFSEHIVIDHYERILKIVANHEIIHNNCSWPENVPNSAARTLVQWLYD